MWCLAIGGVPRGPETSTKNTGPEKQIVHSKFCSCYYKLDDVWGLKCFCGVSYGCLPRVRRLSLSLAESYGRLSIVFSLASYSLTKILSSAEKLKTLLIKILILANNLQIHVMDLSLKNKGRGDSEEQPSDHSLSFVENEDGFQGRLMIKQELLSKN
uniref:Uncharacterized protein n=1 Tax=Lactuca sativa TaxID=4236 RepID=A0A9R1XCA1_LACSA|nr:hypothetical protein LSAT_V11C500287520 [Lactuca sativa]